MSERDDRSAHDGGADDPGGESNQTSPTLRRLLAVSVGVLGFGVGGMVFGGLLSNILFVLAVVALSATVLVSLVVAAGRAIFTSVDSARPWLSGAVAALVGGGLLVGLKSLVWSYNCRRAERIHAAAVTYREAHGEYPDTVDEMAPTHLEDRADGLFRPAAYMLIPADDRLTVAWGPDTYYDPRHDACVGE